MITKGAVTNWEQLIYQWCGYGRLFNKISTSFENVYLDIRIYQFSSYENGFIHCKKLCTLWNSTTIITLTFVINSPQISHFFFSGCFDLLCFISNPRCSKVIPQKSQVTLVWAVFLCLFNPWDENWPGQWVHFINLKGRFPWLFLDLYKFHNMPLLESKGGRPEFV